MSSFWWALVASLALVYAVTASLLYFRHSRNMMPIPKGRFLLLDMEDGTITYPTQKMKEVRPREVRVETMDGRVYEFKDIGKYPLAQDGVFFMPGEDNV
jgi:hypothetical protein